MATENNQQTPENFKRGFPSRSGKPFPQINRPKPVGTISGAYMVLYTIMHHFASEIHYCTSNQVAKPITHFKGRLPPFGLTIHDSY
ncbi:hypothetical protein O181_117353 [Austropuccinia psidii MF-1]|uniref:Uncharacterized protein n=1 Tax=Austropuccinia psidii MF-1 TaxID=1389203 RepID=A0A9Q3PXE2_9BASI|nr:hypothetical protein [Austropuccinia psidii MF-1]